ncbi:hypothetical protein [Streptomyces sp. NPDC056660]|uniref:hypothetical protein n=1 Tax=Streptomyces sp. NPDC056660 TaxID=3345897 RepID=UPI0036C589B4
MSAGPERLQWTAPAPLWTADTVGTASPAFLRPLIAELDTDAFLDVFLAMAGGTGGRAPTDLAGLPPDQAPDGTYPLYWPTAHRYYLVAASLVCRRPGIPDHAVQPALGERPFFVIRPAAAAGPDDALLPDERQLPLHATPVAAFAPPGSTAATLGMAADSRSTRTLFYGFVPVSDGDPDVRDPTAHVIRTVLARDPCPPVLGAPSHPFTFAGPLPPPIGLRTGLLPTGSPKGATP